MPPKRKKRVYENTALTRKGVNLGEQKNYDAWRQGPRAAPYWSIFEQGFLASDRFTEGSKGEEFLNVYNQILEGEADGAGKYSSDGAETGLQSAMDWQAWLLLKLVTNNTSYRNGCLYGCTEPKPVIFEKMWNTIKNELRNRSRDSKSASKAKKTLPSRKSRKHETSSEEDAILDPEAGLALVTWTNMPLKLRGSGGAEQLFENFCGYSLDSFRTAVEERFQLATHNQLIAELTEVSNRGFPEVQAMSAEEGSEGVFYTLRTRKAAFQQELAPLPSEVVATPQQHQSGNEAEHRRLAWAELTADARGKGANTLDLDVPFWQFSFLKSLGDEDPQVTLEDVVLRFSDNDEDNTLEFTHELLDLTRALDDADVEEDTVDGSQIPPLTRYREITQAERDAYREQAQWLDNKEYQRDNHLEACRNLGIEDPERPRIEGLYPARTLEFYQPTAINAIVEFEDSALKGGLLADDMGIGKTVEIIGLLLHRSNQRRSAIANDDPVDPALPTLILMPRTLITQWRDEILRFTDRFRIVVYYGASKKHAQGRVIHPRGKLDQSSEFFGGAEINADTIILSTYSTWASRHGPKTQIDWLIRDFMQSNGVSRNAAKEHINRTHTKNVATKRCAIQLQGCFERVILDEGHEIRHMSPQVGTAVRWVGGKYRVVVTGTPILNGLVDICGIMRFLQPPELESEEYLRTLGLEARGNDALQKTLESFNPWAVDDDDPRAILRFTTAALDEWVFNSRTTTEQRAIRMRAVFEACMIRRSLSSTIGDKRIGDSLPEVQRINIQCEFTDVERRYYDYLYADTSSQLFKKSKSGEELSWNTTTYRKLCLITSWLGMGWLLEYKATKLKKIREHRDNPVKFLRDVRAGQARAKIPVAAQIQVPQKEDRVQLIRMHCTGSPKLRQLLSIIAELVVLQKEKVTVWVNSPFQMEWLDCVFKLCGLVSKQLRADLTTDERNKLIKQFLEDPVEPQILVCSYAISVAGVNMHLRCRTVIEFEPAASEGIRRQLVGRVRRKGQTRYCRHITLVTKNSFNTQQEAVTLLRSLPMLMTQLDLDVFGRDEEEMDRDHALGEWVLYDNDILPVSNPEVANLDLPVLDPDTLLMYISLKMAGHELKGDITSLKKAAKGLKQVALPMPTEPLWQ